jgi:predicted DsbA family dithiol-disulfide isomerase
MQNLTNLMNFLRVVFCFRRCFVGLRNLESAIAQLQKTSTDTGAPVHTFDVKFAPYLLRPTGLPEEGIELAGFVAMRFGPAGNDRMRHLSEVGRASNINFTSNRLMVPSMRAHRLVEFAQAHALCDAVVLMEAIFSAYFEHGAVINQISVLADIAAQCGLDREQVACFLASSELEDVVFARYREALELGINGVPYFVIDVVDQPDTAAGWDELSSDDDGSSISRPLQRPTLRQRRRALAPARAATSPTTTVAAAAACRRSARADPRHAQWRAAGGGVCARVGAPRCSCRAQSRIKARRQQSTAARSQPTHAQNGGV